MIKAGEKYRHFKGTIYEIVGLAKHSENLSDLVIYKNGENETVITGGRGVKCDNPSAFEFPLVDGYVKYEKIL